MKAARLRSDCSLANEFPAIVFAESRFFLADRLVAEEAIGRTGNLALQCGPRRNRLVVTEIAVSVIGDLVR